jgi:hypothetical protein
MQIAPRRSRQGHRTGVSMAITGRGEGRPFLQIGSLARFKIRAGVVANADDYLGAKMQTIRLP